MKMKILLITFSLGALMADLIQDFLNAKYQFIAVMAVVFTDAVFGIAKAFKLGNFETRKTFKALYMLVGLWLLLATVLLIEKGFPFASFMSEAILLPIITFQVISILKNIELLGIIDAPVLKNILSRIDNHKTSSNMASTHERFRP